MGNIILKISVVQAYINHLTDRTVNINIPTTDKRMKLLDYAYDKAIQYFSENDGRIYSIN